MFERRKPRKNFRKSKRRERRIRFFSRFWICFKIMMGLGLLAATSTVFIFIHDVITQCDYFKASSILIEGEQRLSERQIAEFARIKENMNIFAVNLTVVRKRLLLHPWIAEAVVIREIPTRLIIRIKEHVPLAIVDLGRRFLINEKGEIIKIWTPSDPSDLPLISGLEMSDLAGSSRNERMGVDDSSPAGRHTENSQNHYSPLDAVMQVLRLGKQSGSILPNKLIKHILVDREIGLTLHALSRVKTINLGYHNYADKYAMLRHIIAYLKQTPNVPVFERIDLNNLNRIVVSPKRDNAPEGENKEV
ncbi:MAG: FtsQ-type POTRA domain-containing protein [Desulfobacterales bacterium]|nr:MAG: FtsQ-type POTRA domain-containing protein [Desulfobacterales bacterium]